MAWFWRTTGGGGRDMRRPSARQWRQAARLLRQGRVRVIACGRYGMAAEVEGRTGTYCVTLTGEGWNCDCKLRDYHPSWACNHIAACWMVYQAMKGVFEDAENE